MAIYVPGTFSVTIAVTIALDVAVNSRSIFTIWILKATTHSIATAVANILDVVFVVTSAVAIDVAVTLAVFVSVTVSYIATFAI